MGGALADCVLGAEAGAARNLWTEEDPSDLQPPDTGGTGKTAVAMDSEEQGEDGGRQQVGGHLSVF